jgi:hypothetical protein
MIQVTHLSFDGMEARAVIDIDGEITEVFLRTVRPIRSPRRWGDVWAPFGLFPGMRLKQGIRLNVPASRRRRKNLSSAQSVLVSRFPDEFVTVKLTAPRGGFGFPRQKRHVGQFFTGGVDSFYTMLTNPQVDFLVYAFDFVNEPIRITEILRPHLRAIADHYGKELIELEYNARAALDPFADWGKQSYPSVLSSFAAFLSGELHEMIIPSQYAGTATEFWGDHPDINDWWAPGDVSYVYDSGDVSRFVKTALIAKDEFARDHLRVCWQATDRLNCGHCEKCIRTRTALDIIVPGVVTAGFPAPLDVKEVSGLTFPHVIVHEMWMDNLNAALAAGRHDLARAIEKAFANSVS